MPMIHVTYKTLLEQTRVLSAMVDREIILDCSQHLDPPHYRLRLDDVDETPFWGQDWRRPQVVYTTLQLLTAGALLAIEDKP